MYIYPVYLTVAAEISMSKVDLMNIQMKSLGLQAHSGSSDTFNHSYSFFPHLS